MRGGSRLGSLLRRAYSTESVVDSLRIQNPKIRAAVVDGVWNEGPPSLKSRRARIRYQSPEGLSEAFPLAYDIILKEKARHYKLAEEIKQKLAEASEPEEKTALQQLLNKHLVQAEVNDPEVNYNHRINAMDLRQPVYRHLAQRDWKSYDMLLLVQRLEQLHVLPDTMPTINPRAKVDLQFPTAVNQWTTPGQWVRNAICAKQPILRVQEFEEIPDNALYTILVVNPDVPDLENDTFKTVLHWGVSNVPLSNVDAAVDVAKADELVSYLPPHPEKNAPPHRLCVWVYRQAQQPGEIRRIDVETADVARDRFDIRAFSDKYGLDAVGAHVWRVKWDLSTPEVRRKYNLGEGNIYSKVRA